MGETLYLVYLEDKKEWYDLKKKRVVSERIAIQRIGEYDPKYANSPIQAAQVLSNLKAMPRQSSEFYEFNKANIPIQDLYSEVKDKIPFRFCAHRSGKKIHYSVDADNEATVIEIGGEEGFIASVQSNRYLYSELYKIYMNSEVLSKCKSQIDFETYLSRVYKMYNLDIDKCLEHEPKLISWDSTVVAFKQFNPDLLESGATPTWDEFLSRLDYPEVFMAWTWALFEQDNFSRQVMWLRGKGNDGKSSILRALSRIYGTKNSAAISKDSEDSRFFFSTVYGKGLATYNDCKNMRFISSGKLQNITGNDYVQVEYKNNHVYHTTVYSKVIVASNPRPEVDFNKTNEASRFIYLKVSPVSGNNKDRGFESRLVKEAYKFLYKCREIYPKYINPQLSDTDIILPDDMIERMQIECTSEESNILTQFMEDCVESGPTYYYPRHKLIKDLKEYMIQFHEDTKKINFIMHDFKERVNRMGVEEARITLEGDKRVMVYKGIRRKGDEECIINPIS